MNPPTPLVPDPERLQGSAILYLLANSDAREKTFPFFEGTHASSTVLASISAVMPPDRPGDKYAKYDTDET